MVWMVVGGGVYYGIDCIMVWMVRGIMIWMVVGGYYGSLLAHITHTCTG